MKTPILKGFTIDMWLGHYESEVIQPDLNITKRLNIRRHPSCKDLQLICGRDIMNQKLNNMV